MRLESAAPKPEPEVAGEADTCTVSFRFGDPLQMKAFAAAVESLRESGFKWVAHSSSHDGGTKDGRL